MNLYKDIPINTLGIHNLDEYLHDIFEKTKIAFKQKEVCIFLVYRNDHLAGFAVCNLSQDSTMVLIRTLPIALDYIDREHAIREYLFTHIKKKFFSAINAVILVRKANHAYRLFCENAGFIKNNNLFIRSEYLQKTYDCNWYDIYEYRLI